MIRTSALLLAVLSVGVTACDGASVNWGPADSSYKGTTRVRGDGVFFNDDYVRAVNRAHFRDTAPDDGNTVYVNTQISWLKRTGFTDPHTAWVPGTSKSTPEITSETYVNRDVSWTLDDAATSARAKVSVCAQMGWPVPDSCGDGGIPTFDY